MEQFLCNICGAENTFELSANIRTPGPLCSQCRSSVRFRLVAFAFSTEIMGGDGFLPATPDKKYIGIGLSDSMPLARGLQRFEGYTNTYFHKEPQLDITEPSVKYENLDFVISSDVFEHTKPPAVTPFLVAASMLRAGGKLLLSVPTQQDYLEHFPNLAQYKLLETKDGHSLVNATKDGRLEVFSDLRFHGGPGSTLEMRVHSRESVEDCLRSTGFKSWKAISPAQNEFGISPIAGLSTVWVATR